MKIRLATPLIQKDSIVDGEGIRSVIWPQGCIHNCPSCHNPETHSFKAGYLIELEELKEQINKLEGQDGITFSGGDPMMQPIPCMEIAKKCKELGFNIWCYTGFLFEELLDKKDCLEFLKYVDVLVDGKFDNNLKSYSAKFRGSKNQRIINVKSSLKKKKAVCVREYIVK